MSKTYRRNVWYQVDGDMSPEKYGGTLAMWDGTAVHVRKIQPVVEYVGERDGVSVGYPFWTRDGYYDDADLRAIMADRNDRGWSPLDYTGHDAGEPAPTARLTVALRFEVACAALDYGTGAEEGPSGWWRDIQPARRVSWIGGAMWRDGRAADAEYRQLVRDASK